MASKFQNTLNSIKNMFNTRSLLNNGKFFEKCVENTPLVAVQPKHEIHLTSKFEYPQAEVLPLPINIDPTESTRFSPQRARDITSTAITTNIWNNIDITMDSSRMESSASDPHIGSYDCTGAVSLSSSMQSNVPSPFGGGNSFTHLHMPGGQWEQGSKWMSHDLQSSHYTNLRRETRKNWSKTAEFSSSDNGKGILNAINDKNLLHGGMLLTMSKFNVQTQLNANSAFKYSMLAIANQTMQTHRCLSSKPTVNSKEPQEKGTVCKSNKESDTSSDANDGKEVTKTGTTTTSTAPSRTEMLKKTIKEYGSSVIVFHVGISLASLGLFYQLVASGLDVIAILDYIGIKNSTINNNIATGASTFVIAYAIHKLFAPFRITITLVSAPLIVRYLRTKGILKTPKNGK